MGSRLEYLTEKLYLLKKLHNFFYPCFAVRFRTVSIDYAGLIWIVSVLLLVFSLAGVSKITCSQEL